MRWLTGYLPLGSLGIPLPFHAEIVKEFSFVNTKVAVHVQHAFQALGLDEHRRLFTPTLWEWPTNDQNLKKLKQCWFPGVHSNIGGSYPDAGISNITLAWMISQFEESDGGILTFDPIYLDVKITGSLILPYPLLSCFVSCALPFPINSLEWKYKFPLLPRNCLV